MQMKYGVEIQSQLWMPTWVAFPVLSQTSLNYLLESSDISITIHTALQCMNFKLT